MKQETEQAMLKKGGEWLGAIRSWIQFNFRNGDTVKWGSSEFLQGDICVLDLEHEAARINGIRKAKWVGGDQVQIKKTKKNGMKK